MSTLWGHVGRSKINKIKYDVLRSLVTIIKNYFVTMEEDDNLFKTTCQICNGFVTCKVRSGELL